MFILVFFILLGVPLESGLRHERRLTRRNLDGHTFVWAWINTPRLSREVTQPSQQLRCVP